MKRKWLKIAIILLRIYILIVQIIKWLRWTTLVFMLFIDVYGQYQCLYIWKQCCGKSHWSSSGLQETAGMGVAAWSLSAYQPDWSLWKENVDCCSAAWFSGWSCLRQTPKWNNKEINCLTFTNTLHTLITVQMWHWLFVSCICLFTICYLFILFVLSVLMLWQYCKG